MFTYSLCMIVKDEEKILNRCLKSYANLFDEIVIVDTGSSDSTKEIAKIYTDKIYDFEWIDDFSAARNFAFSKCSGDYIFSADADEYIDEANQRNLKLLMEAMDDEVDIVQMKYVENTSTVLNVKKEYRPKLFKRLRIFRWQDAVHETVRLMPIVFDSDIEIIHAPESTEHEKRDFKIFLKALSNGKRGSANMYMMYAKELFRCGEDADFADAIDIFENRLSMIDVDVFALCIAEVVLVKAYRLKGMTADFFTHAMKAYANGEPAEIFYELGEYFLSIEKHEQALEWYYAATKAQSVVDVHYSGDLALKRIAQCYEALGDTEAARENKLLAQAWEMPDGD